MKGRFERHQTKKMMPAMTAATAPITIPAIAPGDKPLLFEGVDIGDDEVVGELGVVVAIFISGNVKNELS